MGLTLHHMALGARDVEEMARFYEDVFDLPRHTTHLNDDTTVRSIWLLCGDWLLMIEKITVSTPQVTSPTGVSKGPFLLAFQIDEAHRTTYERRLIERGCPIDDRTTHTSYSRDLEGNRIALSSYPYTTDIQAKPQ